MAAPLTDSFGRVHRDLRISVTDRCNFRCTYCMPAEGMAWLPRSEVLTFEEIHRVARVMVERFGIDSIRLTGGEPTVRAHLPRLVEMLAGLGVELAMTTNGTTLRLLAKDLADVDFCCRLRSGGLSVLVDGRVVMVQEDPQPRWSRAIARDDLAMFLSRHGISPEVGDPFWRPARTPAARVLQHPTQLPPLEAR